MDYWRQKKLILKLYFLTFTEDQRINLPREMWIEIWSFLDFKTLQKTCTLVSKTWFEEIRNSTRLSGEMTLKTSWAWWNVKGYFFDKKYTYSPSKFNPKKHRKETKDINFWWLFLVFLNFWAQKVDVFSMSFQSLLDWILKMRGVNQSWFRNLSISLFFKKSENWGFCLEN